MTVLILGDRIFLPTVLLSFMALVLLSRISPCVFSQKDFEATDQPRISLILEKTGEYCHKLEKTALDFICLEEVSERIDMSRDIIQSRLANKWDRTSSRFFSRVSPVKTTKHRYDYQLIQKGDEIKESRILLEANSRREYKKDADLKTSVFSYNKFLFGPISVLIAENQYLYNYRITEEEIWSGEKVVVLEANPRSSATQNILSGKF